MTFFNKEHFDKYLYVYILALIIIIFIIYIIVKKSKENKKKNNESFTDKEKVLKYFGSKGCPHSKKGSRTYELVKEFEDKYNDIKVQYYWSDDPSHKVDFEKANAEYVPTLTNADFKKIELILSKDEDREEKTEEELRLLLLANIYDQVTM